MGVPCDQVRYASRCRQIGQPILERTSAFPPESTSRHGIGCAKITVGAALDQYMQDRHRHKERLTEKVNKIAISGRRWPPWDLRRRKSRSRLRQRRRALPYGRPVPWHTGHVIIIPDEYVVRMLCAELYSASRSLDDMPYAAPTLFCVAPPAFQVWPAPRQR